MSGVVLVGTSAADLVVSGRGIDPSRQDADPTGARVLTEVWQVRRGDGDVVALELSMRTTPTGVPAIGRDVTERQRAEAEREPLLRREHEIVRIITDHGSSPGGRTAHVNRVPDTASGLTPTALHRSRRAAAVAYPGHGHRPCPATGFRRWPAPRRLCPGPLAGRLRGA
ncbi:hypothetical protein ACFV4N_32760, partial [Actinosynnema sp. NPDC059797]